MKRGIFYKIFRNFWYKLASVILAAFVWAMIQGEQVLEVNKEITVNINIADGYAVRGERIRVKAATLRGPRVLMLEAPNNLEADITVPKGRVGNYRVRLDKDDIKGWNDRLQLIIHDPYLSLYVDREITYSQNLKNHMLYFLSNATRV